MTQKEKEVIYEAFQRVTYQLDRMDGRWQESVMRELRAALFPPPKPPRKVKNKRKKGK